jgi:hypothetical protein
MGAFERKIAQELAADPRARAQLRAIVAPPPAGSLKKLPRAEQVALLRELRDAWELLTRRNQDLSDERLAEESAAGLAGHLEWYFSDEARAIAAGWLVEVLQHLGTGRAAAAKPAAPRPRRATKTRRRRRRGGP